MPDFHENGVKRCARLQSKKSVSGAVKKISRGSVVAENVEGGLIQPPPPAFLGLRMLAFLIVLCQRVYIYMSSMSTCIPDFVLINLILFNLC